MELIINIIVVLVLISLFSTLFFRVGLMLIGVSVIVWRAALSFFAWFFLRARMINNKNAAGFKEAKKNIQRSRAFNGAQEKKDRKSINIARKKYVPTFSAACQKYAAVMKFRYYKKYYSQDNAVFNIKMGQARSRSVEIAFYFNKPSPHIVVRDIGKTYKRDLYLSGSDMTPFIELLKKLAPQLV